MVNSLQRMRAVQAFFVVCQTRGAKDPKILWRWLAEAQTRGSLSAFVWECIHQLRAHCNVFLHPALLIPSAHCQVFTQPTPSDSIAASIWTAEALVASIAMVATAMKSLFSIVIWIYFSKLIIILQCKRSFYNQNFSKMIKNWLYFISKVNRFFAKNATSKRDSRTLIITKINSLKIYI